MCLVIFKIFPKILKNISISKKDILENIDIDIDVGINIDIIIDINIDINVDIDTGIFKIQILIGYQIYKDLTY